jgi:murein DD-endopeptidase MepM/ murein hydrolase activator NlpD
MGIIDTTYYIPIGRWVMFVWRTPAESPWDADFTHMLHSLRFSAETETSIEKQRGSVGRGQRPQKKLSPEQVGIAAAWDQDPPGWDLPFLGGFAITQGPGCGETHQGWLYEAIDYGLPTDTVVQATDGGYVLFADWSGGFGNLVKIRHASDGFDSWYAHLSSYEVQPSHSVWQYQVIGRSGNTGYSTGPHLHFHALDIQSGSTHWIRTLPGTTWYSGSPYSPCDGGWANGG